MHKMRYSSATDSYLAGQEILYSYKVRRIITMTIEVCYPNLSQFSSHLYLLFNTHLVLREVLEVILYACYPCMLHVPPSNLSWFIHPENIQ